MQSTGVCRVTRSNDSTRLVPCFGPVGRFHVSMQSETYCRLIGCELRRGMVVIVVDRANRTHDRIRFPRQAARSGPEWVG